MAKILTQRALDAAKPRADKRFGVRDGIVPGLQLVVHPSGQKTLILLTRVNGKLINLKIGNAAAITLAQAREEARYKLAMAARGEDPRTVKQAAIRSAAETVAVVAHRFVERHAKVHQRSWRETERLLAREVLPSWGRRPIDSITKQDVIALLDPIIDRGAPIVANRTLSVVRAMFNWCIARGTLPASPCDRVKAPAPAPARDRVLDDDELALVWRAATAIGFPYGTITQLLTLTGQRRDEVGAARWSEFDPALTTWTLPRERIKTNVQHQVPISSAVREILEDLPRIAGEAGYVFTVGGRSPVSGFSIAKRNLDAAIVDLNGGTPIPHWTFHDLRRSLASGLASLGVGLPVIERILCHRGGVFRGVQGVYQRYDFRVEMTQALERWSEHVLALASQPALLRVAASR